ncbi:hypothetical protein DT075_35230 [Bacillus licheniformis]|nr:hypothetical protein DT075_35230 [Bacillus licheniformis]
MGILMKRLFQNYEAFRANRTVTLDQGKPYADYIKCQLVRSYDILRTVFVHQQLQKPRQVVLAERQAIVEFEDLADLDEGRQKTRIDQYKQDVQAAGFNLAK